MLLNDWSERSGSRNSAYRSLVRLPQGTVRLTRRVSVAAQNDRLLLAVFRPRQASPSKIEVRVDDQPAAELEVPQEDGGGAMPLEVSLREFREHEVSVQIIQHSPGDQALVEWRAITLTGAVSTSEELGE